MPETPSCHYARLGVSARADPEQLRQAFRRQSKTLHPDTTELPAEQAALRFQQLCESYELLADPARRRLYDEQRLKRTIAPLAAAPPRPDSWQGIGERRPLSGGEWFSLLLLTLALLVCLVFGLGVAALQGRDWQVSPGWLTDEQTRDNAAAPPSHVRPAIAEHTAESALNPGS